MYTKLVTNIVWNVRDINALHNITHVGTMYHKDMNKAVERFLCA